jgi:hypothetical protein
MAAAQDDRGPPAVGTDFIRKWYTQTRPLWIDLVGDYAGKELFLVEGDSLLRECFEDGRLDFDGMSVCFLSPVTRIAGYTTSIIRSHNTLITHQLTSYRWFPIASRSLRGREIPRKLNQKTLPVPYWVL